MNKWGDKYYDAVVINDDIDPNHAGAVRVNVLGVTDGLEVEQLPFATPSVNSIQAVPTKGTYLRISFDEGDVNKPKYLQVSPEKTQLPADYKDNYPNISVANLGGDFFIMTHDRGEKNTIITHPSASKLQWDEKGRLTHDSDKGYNNAGRGAYKGRGGKIQSVLTEGTIDVFCCTPVGNNLDNGGAFQGSEYFFVTHISKSTVNAINGVLDSDFNTQVESARETGTEEETKKELVDADNNVVRNVEFVETTSVVARNGNKTVKKIVLDYTGQNDFPAMGEKILDDTNKVSAHYLVGQADGASVIEGQNLPADQKSGSDLIRGFIQFAELENDCYVGSNFPPLGPKDNEDTISIMLVGDGTNFTDFQYDIINMIIQNARTVFEDDAIRASLLPQSLDPLDVALAAATAAAGGPTTKWQEFDDDKVLGGVDDGLLGIIG
jgi:hypothetical protein